MKRNTPVAVVVKRILAGDIQAAARLLRDLDDGVPGASAVLKKLYARSGRGHVVGITGPPGSGKSTLADRLVEAARKEGRSVGVVAVDPSSHISGGAVLGDRIRMQRHAVDRKVFIRSLAARGSLGGLSRSVFDTVTVMDAMGKELILLETAGVGQDGVKVAGAAHTVLVVLAPGMGDDIQALKAGVLEIGDIYVVNKCGREDCAELVRGLRLALDAGKREDGWERQVLKTDALSGRGINELMDAIERHRQVLCGSRAWAHRSQAMAKTAFLELLEAGIRELISEKLGREKTWLKLLDDLAGRRTDPYSAARRMLRDII
ncbi:MAG: methylmalonyl Co-A mutase-associated GTPase MeaB [Elusimicrobia bacterium]|nr:methylmalonyl Co-A mutase-associated GTPase MeaB [Elusimicrobiota bacterium]